jgi:hypothetical protein
MLFSQPDALHSRILRKAGQKKAEPNRLMMVEWVEASVVAFWVSLYHTLRNSFVKI